MHENERECLNAIVQAKIVILSLKYSKHTKLMLMLGQNWNNLIKDHRNSKGRENQRGAKFIRCEKNKGARIIGFLRCAKIKGVKNKGALMLMEIRY